MGEQGTPTGTGHCHYISYLYTYIAVSLLSCGHVPLEETILRRRVGALCGTRGRFYSDTYFSSRCVDVCVYVTHPIEPSSSVHVFVVRLCFPSVASNRRIDSTNDALEAKQTSCYQQAHAKTISPQTSTRSKNMHGNWRQESFEERWGGSLTCSRVIHLEQSRAYLRKRTTILKLMPLTFPIALHAT